MNHKYRQRSFLPKKSQGMAEVMMMVMMTIGRWSAIAPYPYYCTVVGGLCEGKMRGGNEGRR